MNKRNCISLCVVIVLLAVVIFAGVKTLYSGVGSAAKPENVDESVQTEPEKAEPTAVKKDETKVPEPVKAVQKSGNAAVAKTAEKSEDKPVEKAEKTSFKVKNCKTGKLNTLRQNKDNSIELVDENGKSLWKIPFPGRICGCVGQVDFYNNGKIQFLLAEGKNLHLIDRLGREVESFPKTLPSKAVYGPYEAKKDGRSCWCIDTEGEQIYYNIRATNTLN